MRIIQQECVALGSNSTSSLGGDIADMSQGLMEPLYQNHGEGYFSFILQLRDLLSTFTILGYLRLIHSLKCASVETARPHFSGYPNHQY